MSVNIKEFLREQYESYVPVWKWKFSDDKRKKRRAGVQEYNKIHNACRKSQYVLVAFALLVMLGFEHSRNLFYSAAIRDGVLLLLMEISSFVFLGYFMGLKRLPANYISLVIIKSFAVLERNFRPQVQDFELKVMKESSRFNGQWSLLSYNPNRNVPVTPVESQIRNLGLMFMMIAAAWFLSKITNIDLTRYEKSVLVTTTVGSASAAILLLSTFALEAYPDAIPLHRRWCQIWILFAVSTFIMILLFLLQRYRLLVARKLRPSQNLKLQWECVLFMLAMYITIRYIPVVHKGLSVRNILAHKSANLTKAMVPETVLRFVNVVATYLLAIGNTMAKLYGGAL